MFLCFKDFHFTHLVSGYRNSCHENPHRSQDSAELFDGTLRVAFALHRSKAASSLTLRVPTDCPQKGLVSVVNLLGEMGDVMYIYIYIHIKELDVCYIIINHIIFIDGIMLFIAVHPFLGHLYIIYYEESII